MRNTPDKRMCLRKAGKNVTGKNVIYKSYLGGDEVEYKPPDAEPMNLTLSPKFFSNS